jgi:hypothetical protein
LEEENKNLGLALSDKQFEYAANVLAAESDKYGFERQRARIVELEARLAQSEEKWHMLGALAEGFEQELRQVSTTEAQMANDSDLAGEVEKEGGE